MSQSYSYSQEPSVSVAPPDAISHAEGPDQNSKSSSSSRERYAVFALKLLHAFWGDKALRDIYRSTDCKFPRKKLETEDEVQEEDDMERASAMFVAATTADIFSRPGGSPVENFEELSKSWTDMEAVPAMGFFYAHGVDSGELKLTTKIEHNGSSDEGYVSFNEILAKAAPSVTGKAISALALQSASCTLGSPSGTAQLGLRDPTKGTFQVREIQIGGETFSQTNENGATSLDLSGKVYEASKHRSNCFMVSLLRELGPKGLSRFETIAADGSKTLCLTLGRKTTLDAGSQLLLFLVSQLDHQKMADYKQETSKEAAPISDQPAELQSRASSAPSDEDNDEGDGEEDPGGIRRNLGSSSPSKHIPHSPVSLSSTATREPLDSFSASIRKLDTRENKEAVDEEGDEDEDEEEDDDTETKKKNAEVQEIRRQWNLTNEKASGYRAKITQAAQGASSSDIKICLTAEDSKFILEKYQALYQEYNLLTLRVPTDKETAKTTPALYFHVMGAGNGNTVSYALNGLLLPPLPDDEQQAGDDEEVSAADDADDYAVITLDSRVPESVCVVEARTAPVVAGGDEEGAAEVEISCSLCALLVPAKPAGLDSKQQPVQRFVALEPDDDDEEEGAGGQVSVSFCKCSGSGAANAGQESSSCHCVQHSHSCPRSLPQSKPGSSQNCSCCNSVSTSGQSKCTFCKVHSAGMSSVASSDSQSECSCGKEPASSSSQQTSKGCSVCNPKLAPPNTTTPGKQQQNSSSASWCECSGRTTESCSGCKALQRASSGAKAVPAADASTSSKKLHGSFCHCSETSVSEQKKKKKKKSALATTKSEEFCNCSKTDKDSGNCKCSSEATHSLSISGAGAENASVVSQKCPFCHTENSISADGSSSLSCCNCGKSVSVSEQWRVHASTNPDKQEAVGLAVTRLPFSLMQMNLAGAF